MLRSVEALVHEHAIVGLRKRTALSPDRSNATMLRSVEAAVNKDGAVGVRAHHAKLCIAVAGIHARLAGTTAADLHAKQQNAWGSIGVIAVHARLLHAEL